jgi:hypothetical protein
MGVRRAQHIAISLARQRDVVLEAAIAAQQALVLEAPHRLPYSELAHTALLAKDVADIAVGMPERRLRRRRLHHPQLEYHLLDDIIVGRHGMRQLAGTDRVLS